MSRSKKQTIAILVLGISFGFIYSVLFREISCLQKLELNTYDTFLRWQSPDDPPKEILLVKLNRQYREKRAANPNFSERVFYASLIKQLLENDVAVVVLNLRHYWRDIPDSDWKDADLSNSPLRELVGKYGEQIVLVTRSDSLFEETPSELQTYHHFLPRNDDLSPTIAPNSVQGFSEYELEAENPRSSTSITRRTNLRGEFVTLDGNQPAQKFHSAPLLALEKFARQQNKYKLKTEISFPQTIGVNYWDSSSNFPAFNVEQICDRNVVEECKLAPQLNLRSLVANKIVLVGFSEGRNHNTLPVTTPFGNKIPLLEFQANVLASLITGRYYRVLSVWSQWLIWLVGAIIVSGIFIFNMDSSRLDYPKSFFWIIFGVIFVYVGLTLILWQNYYTLPIVIPLSIWSASAISTCICLVLGLQRQLITQQRQTIEQLQRAEEKAVILQTRKLLQRVASDIHDTALQDLKVIMDRLELELNLDPEFVIDRLEIIGRQIREQLNSMRQMSQKLEISSILRSGIDIGIQANLEQLVDSDQLTLQVIYDLHPIDEPKASTNWIDAREDIYRFFREAINNVLFHAQPPYGNATQVKVSLWREQNRCYLAIIDNNCQTSVTPSVETSTKRRSSGGYGTKIMETIALELPQGAWERTIIPDGGIKVQLAWNFSFDDSHC
ncbi:CHASE2 domain-containing protein [Pleurocapsa sp. PCC 7319]|uniref:CHASE2 domain-containing protein n=1 Tax=Pleurocapsa sp. PCC 7319 TaxID=118161 RepID=UPI00034606B2|nr:CHASE2 domain-containing protein [Pleurocapsa sp. PCC 7319]